MEIIAELRRDPDVLDAGRSGLGRSSLMNTVAKLAVMNLDNRPARSGQPRGGLAERLRTVGLMRTSTS